MAAGDLTDALVSELAIRLEDEEEKEFSALTKITMLDKAQQELCGLLHNAYLTELENISTGEDASSGAVAFSDIDSGGILRGAEGILKVKISPGGSNATWAIRITINDLKKTSNSLQAYSDARPMFYVFNEKVNVLLDTLTATTADIYYLEKPATLTTDVDPQINRSLHPLILDLAEAKCWAMNRKFDRRKAVMDHVMRQIQILNARYVKPEGIGTKKG
jgi:hypothetical protein